MNISKDIGLDNSKPKVKIVAAPRVALLTIPSLVYLLHNRPVTWRSGVEVFLRIVMSVRKPGIQEEGGLQS